MLRALQHAVLGRSVTLSTVSGLVKLVTVSGSDPAELAKVKGSAVMAKAIARAIRLRQRTLREPFEVPFGGLILRMSPDQSKQILERAIRRSGSHNLRRRFVEAEAVLRLMIGCCDEEASDCF